jgi:hypothetical protein
MFFPVDILGPPITVLTARVTFDALELVFISISAGGLGLSNFLKFYVRNF